VALGAAWLVVRRVTRGQGEGSGIEAIGGIG
jgi:hypothetical protein